MPPSQPDGSSNNAGNLSQAEADRMLRRMDRNQRKQREAQGSARERPGKETDTSTGKEIHMPPNTDAAAAAEHLLPASSGSKTPQQTNNNTQYNAPVQVNHRTTNTITNNNYYETTAHVKGNRLGTPGRLLANLAGFAREAWASPARYYDIVRNIPRLFSISLAIFCVFSGFWAYQTIAQGLGRCMWSSPISYSYTSPSSPSPSPTIITVPFAVSVSGPLPTEKGLIFPYARGVRQLLADVQRSSLADTTDIVVLYDQYAMLGAQIDTAWAEALSALLTRMRSELRDMEHYSAATVKDTWCSQLGFHTHPVVPIMQRRIQRFVGILLTGQRIVQDAKRDLVSGRPDQPDGPAAIMNKITQNLCAWADVLDSGALPDDQALADIQRGAGNDASAVCVILERNRDSRVKERLEVLDAFQSLLDEGLVSRWTLQEDLEAANWWFGFDRHTLASLELKMSEVYRSCYAFAGKVFMRGGSRTGT